MSRTLMLACALCFVVVGCGGGSADDAAVDAPPVEEAPADDAAAEDEAAGEDEAAEGEEDAEDEAAGEDEAAMEDGEAVALTFDFVNHIQAGMAEQDVYVMSADEEGMVMRLGVETSLDEAVLGQAAYASYDEVEHDPFNLTDAPLGPFEAGDELGFTIGDWMAATGSGTYSVSGDMATLDLSFEDLVPGGLYTVWCSEVHMPPDFMIVDTPCGAPDGSENGFTAGDDGTATVSLSTAPMPESTAEVTQVIAVAYHSDVENHGPVPGAFGRDTHVHLFHMMPVPEE